MTRPKSPFLLFLKHNYKGQPTRGCGAAWKALSEVEKEPYRVWAKKEKEAWWKEKRSRNSNLPETFPSQSTSSSSTQMPAAACPLTPTANNEAKTAEDDSDVVIESEFYVRRKSRTDKEQPVDKHEPVFVGEVVQLSDCEDDFTVYYDLD